MDLLTQGKAIIQHSVRRFHDLGITHQADHGGEFQWDRTTDAQAVVAGYPGQGIAGRGSHQIHHLGARLSQHVHQLLRILMVGDAPEEDAPVGQKQLFVRTRGQVDHRITALLLEDVFHVVFAESEREGCPASKGGTRCALKETAHTYV